MFKKLQELLEAEKITKELAEELDSEISTVLKAKNDENAKLRVEKKEADERLKTELDVKVQEYEAKLKEAKKEGKAEVEAEYSTKLKEAEAKSAEYAKGIKEANLNALISSTISEIDVKDAYVAKLLLRESVIEDDEGFKIKVDGDVLKFVDGAKKILVDRKQIKEVGAGGSGTGANSTDGFAKDSITAM